MRIWFCYLLLCFLLFVTTVCCGQLCTAPTLISMNPNSGYVYPAQYHDPNTGYDDITCSQSAPCTLDEMIPGTIYGPDGPLGIKISATYDDGICYSAFYWSQWWWSDPGQVDIENGFQVPLIIAVPLCNFSNGCGYVESSTYLAAGSSLPLTPTTFGANDNPLQLVDQPCCTTYIFGNIVYFDLIGPVQMVVQNDVWDYCDGCTTTVRRKVTYQVMNSDGSVAPYRPLGEMVNYGPSNCAQGRPPIIINSCTTAEGNNISNPSGGTANISGGMWATDGSGEFTDGWTMDTDGYTPNGCGFIVAYDKWQICGLGQYWNGSTFETPNVGLTFAALQGTYHNNNVALNVNGKNYILPGNPTKCPPDTSNCANAIPSGTVILPH